MVPLASWLSPVSLTVSPHIPSLNGLLVEASSKAASESYMAAPNSLPGLDQKGPHCPIYCTFFCENAFLNWSLGTPI